MYTHRKNFQFLISNFQKVRWLGWVIFFLLIGYFSYKKMFAFGCFDDCARFVASYFMLKGRTLYSQIFDNHQMLTTYVSYLIQLLSHPKTVSQLVLYHRVVIFLFAVVFDILLIKRFKKAGALFVLLYEPTKFFLFGERFLSESFIVYPLVYLFGLAISKLQGSKLSNFDLLASAIFAWFVIFSREPYIPVALVLFLLVWFSKKLNKQHLYSGGLFAFLCAITLLTVPLKDYLYQVFVLNFTGNSEAGSFLSFESLRIFFYPILILFTGKATLFRVILIGFDFAFLFLMFKNIKNRKLIIFIFIILGLSNVRYVIPGTQFYEAFHLVQWYGLFIFSLAWMIKISNFQFPISNLLIIFTFIILFSPKSYVWDHTNRQGEFITGYGEYVANGFVVRTLATPNSTLFADRVDDLLYWVSDIKPAYKYSWYFAGTEEPVFKNAYNEMFAKSPPDFYFSPCSKVTHQSIYLPTDQFRNYDQVFFAGKPTCMYVRKEQVGKITKGQIKKLNDYQYSLQK